MRVLIVGGTGRISTAITRQQLARGDEVTHFNRGRSEVRYAVGGAGAERVRRIEGDRKNAPEFEALVQAAGPFDCVMDMICFLPEEAESLLRAVRGRTDHLIVCSTVDVYRRPAERYPIAEGAPLEGVSAYGKAKARCEALLMAAHRRGDVPVTTIRPAQTYGEGRDLIHTFGRGTVVFDRLRRGLPVIVHGDGSGFWVACHIDDVARAFVGGAGNRAAFGKAHNATGEEWLTWDHYTELLAEGLGAPPPRIVHIPTDLLVRLVPQRARILAENFRFPNVFDNGAASRDLGFRYTVPFLEGVRRTVAWLDARGEIAPAAGDPLYDRLVEGWERMGAGLAAEMEAGAAPVGA